MKATLKIRVKTAAVLMAALIILSACTSGLRQPGQAPAPVDHPAIALIDPPAVTLDKDGGFSFFVFGDTRTAESDDKPDDRMYHRLRNIVHREIASRLETGGSFAMYSGDLVWRGSRAGDWLEMETLVPPALRRPDAPRFFPVLGNHELWQMEGESDALDNFYGFFPTLVRENRRLHNYAFIVADDLFVFLCSGGYGKDPARFELEDRRWTCSQVASFDALAESLRTLCLKRGLRNIFVQYHKPSFSTEKHPPLDKDNDPLEVLKTVRVQHIVVFNGHNHTTELFHPRPNLWVLVAGGGGAPQKTGVPIDDHGKPMPELFWKTVGGQRYPRVNYFRVRVGHGPGAVRIEEKVLCASGDGNARGASFITGVILDTDHDVPFLAQPAAGSCDVRRFADFPIGSSEPR